MVSLGTGGDGAARGSGVARVERAVRDAARLLDSAAQLATMRFDQRAAEQTRDAVALIEDAAATWALAPAEQRVRGDALSRAAARVRLAEVPFGPR